MPRRSSAAKITQSIRPSRTSFISRASSGRLASPFVPEMPASSYTPTTSQPFTITIA